ncbi:hypothetical protein B0H10DRAFT_1771725 [Mycena sp. CBHHK59/15]|nr:hypothetical protein B0H10DRAFT_1771725 [Mycena sp. CBHHK59/15]
MVQSTVSHLIQSALVRIRCHGMQDLHNPLDSGVLLGGGRLKITQIMRKTGDSDTSFTATGMSLAFLSVCETAKGNLELPDEAMHLAATLIFARFRGIVATMWTIADDGPKVADSLYEYLFKNCDASSDPPIIPDLTEAASALHIAVGKLREDPSVGFMRWVPFVDYGL